MANNTLTHAVRLGLLSLQGGELNDGQLLERFVERRDQVAFEVLVKRHGPMVLRVCRRVLGNQHDAEDAFQAAFVVLARKAGGLTTQAWVGGWLHKVAYRIALRARSKVSRQLPCTDEQVEDRRGPAADVEVDAGALRLILDEELNLLPDKYREPLVLCCLNGKTIQEAASVLSWPVGTVASRLARGRERLRSRLARRGVVVSEAALVACLTEQALALTPPALVATTGAVALQTPGAASTPAALATGYLLAQDWHQLRKLGLYCSGLLLVGVIACLLAVRQGLGWNEPGTWPLLATLEGHTDGVFPVAFAPDGQKLVSGGVDGQLRFWNVASRREKAVLGNHVACSLAFAPNGKHILTGSWYGIAKVVDAQTGRDLVTFTHRVIRDGDKVDGMVAAAFSPDGRQLALGDRDGFVRFYDLETVLREGSRPENRIRAQVRVKNTTHFWLNEISIWHAKQEVLLSNVAVLKETSVIRLNSGNIHGLAFAPAGGTLAAGGKESGTRLWDLAGDRPPRLLQAQPSSSVSVAFSPDGRYLAAGVVDRTVEIWDLASGKRRAAWQRHEHMVLSVAFSPDGRLLASAGWEGTVRIWDVAQLREVAVLRGHKGGVNSVAFSPDGTMLASGSMDKTIKLWQVRTDK